MANQAVVGVLRTILTAETAQFDTSMRKVSQTVVKFGQETIKLTNQGEKLAAAFGGGKLLASANQLTGAIAKLGGQSGLLAGAAKLTAAEQQRVNARVTEAIAKYRALGQSAPASMIALEKATRQADTATSRWSTALKGANTILGAFGITLGATAVINFGRQLLDAGDAIVRLADRTGLTTDEVQQLQFVAEQSGNSVDELTSAIGQLQNRLVSGDKSAIAAVQALGLNLKTLRASAPIDQLKQIATAITGIPDPAARAAIAMDLFGRTGIAILPTLVADFDRLADAAPKMSEATVRALDDAGDTLNLFQLQLKVWAAEAFNFAGRLFDQYVIVLRRGAARASEVLADLFGLLAKAPLVGGPFAQLAAKLRADAQLLRDGANATEAALNRVEPAVRKNTGALIDYEAILDRTRGTTKKTKDETSALLPVFQQYFGLMSRVLPVVQDNTASAEAYNLVATGNIDDVLAWAEAERALNDELRRKGMLLPTITDNKASQQLAQDAEESAEQVRDTWGDAMRDIGQRLTMSISDALGDALVGLHSFKDAFLSIWDSIRRSLSNILATMLDSFVGGFLKGLLNALGGAKIGQAIGNSLMGAGAGAALGGGTAAAGGAGAAGAGAGLSGLGGSVAALASNPITWAVAGGALLAFGIVKKGLFRGGEEALHVNPRRDQFLSQFGNPAEKGVGGAAHNLAAILTRLTGFPGGGPLFRGLQQADSVKEFVAAQTAVITQLAKGGVRGIKAFQFGGFIPPGVTQFAMLHGGEFGEMVTPLRSHPNAATMGNTVHSYNFTIHAMDGADVKRVLEREVWPRFNRETVLNQHGVASSIKRVSR